MAQAQHFYETVTGCENQGESGDRCELSVAPSTSTRIRSDEIGRGPFTDNQWALTIRNGKITSANATWAFLTNGFSAEIWQPFQAWVASTHPEDLPAMYLGATPAITSESIPAVGTAQPGVGGRR